VADSNRGRQLGLVAILAVAGAGLAAIAAALTWWSAEYVDPLSGALTITASGAACVPELIPLALVSLAGFGAALATRGVPRRIVGVVIALCGAAVAVRSAMFFGGTPAALVSQLTRPADPVGAAQSHPFGPGLGLLAGLLLAAAGVLVLLGFGARQAMGSRYERRARTQPAVADQGAPDQGDWWKSLDAGDDPTAASTSDGSGETPPAVSEHTSGDGYHDPNAGRAPG
jgi:uncharacterized membrane protein (TIGR02234 family)